MNAGTWNLQQWKTGDEGKSWATDLIANGFGPSDENVRPYVPLNRPSDTEMVMWLRGQYDYWNLSKGVGYDMSVQLWSKPLGGSSNSVPEPSSLSAVLIAGALLIRRRR